MKKATCIVTLVLLAACQQNGGTKHAADRQKERAHNDSIRAEKEERRQEQESPKLPPVRIYAGREFTTDLEKELDERNARQRRYKGEQMTLVDSEMGEDGGYITFRDSKGKTYTFSGWPNEPQLSYHEVEFGEDLDESEKGKKYEVTYALEAYWSDPAGEVVENLVVKTMKRL